jgi:uncharacterized glyoxalase superfamily protein PhnB
MLNNRSMPRCTVIPELAYPDVGEAVDWLCSVFGFTLRIRIGNHRAQLKTGDGALVVIELPEGTDPTLPTHSIMVRVEDIDRHYEFVKEQGARVGPPPADYPYGERQYNVVDFAGHRWTFSQSIADVAPESWGGVSGEL